MLFWRGYDGGLVRVAELGSCLWCVVFGAPGLMEPYVCGVFFFLATVLYSSHTLEKACFGLSDKNCPTNKTTQRRSPGSNSRCLPPAIAQQNSEESLLRDLN